MPEQSLKRTIILASSSPYRKLLLQRLMLPFEVYAPDIDECALESELPDALVQRLAGEKARAAAQRFPQALVIGSDQVAVCDGKIIGKPGSVENACRQLAEFSGKCVVFHSAVAVHCADNRFLFEDTIDTEVCFRQLSEEEIARYIGLEAPLDCAGSFKSEAAGISLLTSMSSTDPTAIIGLPLITVARALRLAGFDAP